MSFNAKRGDINLDESTHTAMCVRNDGTADLLAEFSISETGGIDAASVKQTPQCGVCSEQARALSERTSRPLGDRYDEVQAEVTRILSGGSSGGSYDVDALARRVIAGEFGNGDTSSVKQTPQCGVCSEKARASSERCPCLGDKYSAVQRRVNEILGASGASSTSMDVDAMARTVIRGDYGNGEEHRHRLESYYSVVQARVNEMLS